MSPTQFQRGLRLQKARRQMMGEDCDAATAALHIDHDDPFHFSRDYKKHFGEPLARDAARLRSIAVAEVPS